MVEDRDVGASKLIYFAGMTNAGCVVTSLWTVESNDRSGSSRCHCTFRPREPGSQCQEPPNDPIAQDRISPSSDMRAGITGLLF